MAQYNLRTSFIHENHRHLWKEKMSKIPSGVKKLLNSKGRGRIGVRYLDYGLWKSIGRPPYKVMLTYHVSLNMINLEPLHMHYWHNPSSCIGPNFGFFKKKEGIYPQDGIYPDTVKVPLKKYTFIYFGPSYFNSIMEEVESNLKIKNWKADSYKIKSHNCQHFMQQATKLYDLILQEKIKEYHRSLRHFRRTFGGAT